MDKIFEKYSEIFLIQNSKLNLISKNDEKFLWEKHIKDSLAIEKFFEKYHINPSGLTMLDIGTGGGFPSVPVAIKYPNLKVTALDSIRKKINAIEEIKTVLDIKNLVTICDRAENLTQKFDIVTARAVSGMKTILEYALPRLKKDGYFVAYKSIKAGEEIEDAKEILQKYNAEVMDIIPYELPLQENFTRNLVIVEYVKTLRRYVKFDK